MNIQEAYKKIDLAKGLSQERVESQYRRLKEEIELKLLNTQTDRLKQVYFNRLQEIEEAYLVLINHFKNGDYESLEGNKKALTTQSFTSKKNELSKNKKVLIIVSVLLILVALPILYFNFIYEEIDLFRKIEGEKQVFVNNLTLRQYPDEKSSKIELFPFGTRLIYEENDLPKTDSKQRVWQKVRVIHPVYGWDRPDDRFPYPYEGWMAVEECGVSWVADSLKINNLTKILGNDEAGRSVSSLYRNGLIDLYEKNNYFGEWILYEESKTNTLQNALLIKLGNSYKDCNGEDQFDFIVVLNNINNQKHKFLLMSTNSEAKSWVVFEEEFYGDYKGMRILSSSELKLFNRAAGIYFQNAAYINRSNGDNILAMKNGEVYTYYWNNIN